MKEGKALDKRGVARADASKRARHLSVWGGLPVEDIIRGTEIPGTPQTKTTGVSSLGTLGLVKFQKPRTEKSETMKKRKKEKEHRPDPETEMQGKTRKESQRQRDRRSARTSIGAPHVMISSAATHHSRQSESGQRPSPTRLTCIN